MRQLLFHMLHNVIFFRQHYNSKLPLEILSEMKIGTLHPDDVAAMKNDNRYEVVFNK